jgi:hypothetical protein
MSMIFRLARIPGPLGEEWLRDPQGIDAVLYPEEAEERAAAAIAENDLTHLDRAWHALHFLFTGTDWEGEFPPCFLVLGGAEVGEVDAGHGPARIFDAALTASIDGYLQSLDEAELKGRFDPARMTGLAIYPEIWDEKKADELWDYVAGHFHAVKGFIRDTAAAGKALLVFCH